jgi:hypothetical protein
MRAAPKTPEASVFVQSRFELDCRRGIGSHVGGEEPQQRGKSSLRVIAVLEAVVVGNRNHVLQPQVYDAWTRPPDVEDERYGDSHRSSSFYRPSSIFAGRYDFLALENYPLACEATLQLVLMGTPPRELAITVCDRGKLELAHFRRIQPAARPRP